MIGGLISLRRINGQSPPGIETIYKSSQSRDMMLEKQQCPSVHRDTYHQIPRLINISRQLK